MHLISGAGAVAVLLTAYLLYPLATRVRDRMIERWRSWYELAALALACAGFGEFILHFGNRQFGGFDFSLLIDAGWRLFNGQLPYRDFICTLPPGFILGVKYGFYLFGVQWNAVLGMAAAFTCITFLWFYFLLRQLMRTLAAAFLLALCIECAAMLSLSYWWYNNVTSIIATAFLLSCLAYYRRPELASVKVSYVVALTLLGLMKPNIAAPLALASILLLLLAVPVRPRLAALTGVGIIGTLLILAANGISFAGMIASYRAAAAARGGFSTIGFRDVGIWGKLHAAGFLGSLLIPFIGIVKPSPTGARQGKSALVGTRILPFVAPLIGIYAMFSNMESKEVEWPIIFSTGAVLIWGDWISSERSMPHRWLPRFYASILCALVCSGLYLGGVRHRVFGIGIHTFFEWEDANHSIDRPFFRDLQASRRFQNAVAEAGQVLSESPGPFYFGPRMEFAYAVFGIQSPLHLPIWWHPGSSFAIADEGTILETWQRSRFGTLVYLKDEFPYYSARFRQLIDSDYIRDNRWPELSVFHAKRPAADGAGLPRSSELGGIRE